MKIIKDEIHNSYQAAMNPAPIHKDKIKPVKVPSHT